MIPLPTRLGLWAAVFAWVGVVGVALAQGGDRGGYVPGGDPAVPHPGTVPNMHPQLAAPPPDVKWEQILTSQRFHGFMNTVEVDPTNPEHLLVGTKEGTIVRSLDGGVTWRELELFPFVIAERSLQVPKRPSLKGGIIEGIVTVLQPPGALRLFEFPRLNRGNALEYAVFPEGLTGPIARGTGSVRFNQSTVNFNRARPITGELSQLVQARPMTGPGTTGGFRPGSYVDVFYIAGGLSRRDAFSTRATMGRREETVPVRLIAVCPGNPFSVLAVTSKELYGSPDGGETYVRLMRIPGRIRMRRVRCSYRDPKRVLVATRYGAFVSSDGGTTFDPELTARPGDAATAVNFGNPDHTGKEIALIALGVRLFRGHPDGDEGLEWAYPNFNNSDTAPWTKINDVIATPNGQIWLATMDGVRLSRDNGNTWEVVAPLLFNNHKVVQIAATGNEWGGLRIGVFVDDCPLPPLQRRAICRNHFVYATDDGGHTWYPFFVGMGRRIINWMTASPYVPGERGHWWVITEDALWTDRSPFAEQRKSPHIDRQIRAWAKERLRKTPSLYWAKETSFRHLKLSRDAMDDMWRRARGQAAIPEVRLLFDAERIDTDADEFFLRRDGAPLTVRDVDAAVSSRFWSIQMQLRWQLARAKVYLASRTDPNDSGEANATRKELYELRRQVDYLVEDLWHERIMHLRRLADGMTDEYQIAVLQERTDLLELLLEFWMGRPLPTLPRRLESG